MKETHVAKFCDLLVNEKLLTDFLEKELKTCLIELGINKLSYCAATEKIKVLKKLEVLMGVDGPFTEFEFSDLHRRRKRNDIVKRNMILGQYKRRSKGK